MGQGHIGRQLCSDLETHYTQAKERETEREAREERRCSERVFESGGFASGEGKCLQIERINTGVNEEEVEVTVVGSISMLHQQGSRS